MTNPLTCPRYFLLLCPLHYFTLHYSQGTPLCAGNEHSSECAEHRTLFWEGHCLHFPPQTCSSLSCGHSPPLLPPQKHHLAAFIPLQGCSSTHQAHSPGPQVQEPPQQIQSSQPVHLAQQHLQGRGQGLLPGKTFLGSLSREKHSLGLLAREETLPGITVQGKKNTPWDYCPWKIHSLSLQGTNPGTQKCSSVGLLQTAIPKAPQ